ncbi:predicted protein [Aspergillus terreus NIH2624]|uniref:Uncharacterized protein n=1 Tax=Aspergillus terreus (strain NIH 2624 / FGSC A1156) TaxID=341663 RepID=Q0CQZ9_ASPTN|nr:uncharacterized protein ATEG_03885 [Aspergillus terreus NIH2624]EAU35687.1 predicted protein [Aspergillus terreus NIH2624]
MLQTGKDLSGYCQGLIKTGLSRLPKEVPENHNLLPHQGSIQDHIRLIEISQEVMRKLIEDKRIQDAAAPVLLPPDFNKRNIYVSPDDPTVITGIIDWQSASIEPAFIYANDIPDFASLPEEPEKELEDAQVEPKTPSDKERERKDALICHQTYDVCMKGLAPKLRPARLLDQTLFRLFHYCHTTWGDSAPAVRQELIELSTCWKELGLQGSCPFSPTDEELERHARDYDDFEAVQRLKLLLKHALNTNSDGWVPNEEWEAAKEVHRELYDQWIETAREVQSSGEDLTVDKADKMWPFNAR